MLEACQDLWDEFEHVFLKLATRADSDFARGLCASELGLCAKPIEREAFKAELWSLKRRSRLSCELWRGVQG